MSDRATAIAVTRVIFDSACSAPGGGPWTEEQAQAVRQQAQRAVDDRWPGVFLVSVDLANGRVAMCVTPHPEPTVFLELRDDKVVLAGIGEPQRTAALRHELMQQLALRDSRAAL